MHNLKYLTLALLLATLATTPTFAKPGQYGEKFGKGEQQETRLEHLKERLDLTTQQEAEIEELLSSTKAKNQALREEKRKTREELKEISRAETLDESRLRELLNKQSNQRADIMIAKHATRAKINQLLTPEQQEQHEAFRKERSETSKHRQGKRR